MKIWWNEQVKWYAIYAVGQMHDDELEKDETLTW